MAFRNKTPIRRTDPKKISNYQGYKNDLRVDFNYRCGYCDDHDYFALADYQIDHFVPKAQLKSISPASYSNLVYSCRSCNRAKWDQWHTGDEIIPNDGSVGFIDPCDKEYEMQFSRNSRGEIVAQTTLGIWMWKALNLGNPAHSLIWKLEQIRKRIDELQVIADKYPVDSTVSIVLRDLYKRFIDYLDQLKGGAPVF